MGFLSYKPDGFGYGRGSGSDRLQKKNDSAMAVKTYNISSYSSIVPEKLSFEVWDMRAEESDGLMSIFTKVKVPEKIDILNHVWQVGPSISDGRPTKMSFSQRI